MRVSEPPVTMTAHSSDPKRDLNTSIRTYTRAREACTFALSGCGVRGVHGIKAAFTQFGVDEPKWFGLKRHARALW